MMSARCSVGGYQRAQSTTKAGEQGARADCTMSYLFSQALGVTGYECFALKKILWPLKGKFLARYLPELLGLRVSWWVLDAKQCNDIMPSA